MAQATVKTVQFIDPRIEPQPDPVYDYIIGPTQNQYYKIPASGISDSSITFNNLTTLGIDRAYLDTFEIEVGIRIIFHVSGAIDNEDGMAPLIDSWTFDSFPFNKCCEEAHVNINGGAFFSQPMSYVRAKERYMNQYELAKSYENVCPCHKPILQTESGRDYNRVYLTNETDDMYDPNNYGIPTRYGVGMYGFNQSAQGMDCGFNNSILRLGTKLAAGVGVGYTNYHIGHADEQLPAGEENHYLIVDVAWREPIFVSPFSSKYDATYGRPLYNITSMDFSFTMQNLGNMIRLANIHYAPSNILQYVKDYTVHIRTADLCYQVMTIPPILNKPLTTLVPYRRFVPYITDYPNDAGGNVPIDGSGSKNISIKSGVYTFNEIPTAIWLFVGPSKKILQNNYEDFYRATNPELGPPADLTGNADVNAAGNWDSNKLFGFIKHVDISMANTTQILNTAKITDLYRIAKANGCEDSFWSWAGEDTAWCKPYFERDDQDPDEISYYVIPRRMYYGAGSVLRLKPGVDIIIPDMPLIPGANAHNMVFQATVEAAIPPHSYYNRSYSLWCLFEYVGVAAISPGQCEISMNPLGSGEIMAVSPVMSATSEQTEGKLEGSGFWDTIKRAVGIAGQLGDDGILSMILKRIPGAEGVSDWAKKHGLGEPATKRGRNNCSGGAVIGKGLNDWV